MEPQRLNEKYTRILEFLVESEGKRKAPRRDKAAEVEQLLLFLQQHEDPPKFFRAAEIGRALGIDAGRAGQLLQEAIPVKPVRGKGYPSRVIYDFLARGGKSHLKGKQTPLPRRDS